MTALRGTRVLLRPWRDDDLTHFAALNADPDVMRHLSAPLAAALALRHAFGPLRLPLVVSLTVPDSRPSVAAMQRIGLRLRGGFDQPRFPECHRLRRHVLHAAGAPGPASPDERP